VRHPVHHIWTTDLSDLSKSSSSSYPVLLLSEISFNVSPFCEFDHCGRWSQTSRPSELPRDAPTLQFSMASKPLNHKTEENLTYFWLVGFCPWRRNEELLLLFDVVVDGRCGWFGQHSSLGLSYHNGPCLVPLNRNLSRMRSWKSLVYASTVGAGLGLGYGMDGLEFELR
jgi:hypothetical protein